MKKLIALLMVLVMSIGAMAAFAEDEDMVTYLEEHPEAAGYVSTWIAEDGDWRIEVFDEDGGLKLMVVHKLDDGSKEDIWEYAAATNTLTATGDFGDEPITAVFSYNEENQIVWIEDGVSTVLELSTVTD